MAEVIREAAERNPASVTFLTSHGGSIKYGTAALLGWPDEILPTLASIGNCHWVELLLDESHGWRAVTYNGC